MVLQTIMMILIACFGYLHSYMGSTMHDRPIIIAPLVGLVLGDLQTGIIVGATLELVFMGAFPIGASNPPDFVSGTIIATSYVIQTGQEVASAVALAVPIATLVLIFANFLMTVVLTWAAHIADRYAEQGNIEGVEWVHRLSSFGYAIVLGLVVGFGFVLGVPVIEKVLSVIPEFVTHGMDVAAGIIPAIGFAMLARMMMTKKTLPFLLLGFLMAAYLGIPLIGIALFGLVVVMIFVNYMSQQGVVADENEF